LLLTLIQIEYIHLLIKLTEALVQQVKGSNHYLDIQQSGALMEQKKSLISCFNAKLGFLYLLIVQNST